MTKQAARPRYRNAEMQNAYAVMRAMAADPASNLYYLGEQHRGSAYRCAFWDGFNGQTRPVGAGPSTLVAACFAAGQDFAKDSARILAAIAKAGGKS